LYGVVIREPQSFSDRLSEELEARLPEVVLNIATQAGMPVPRAGRVGQKDAEIFQPA